MIIIGIDAYIIPSEDAHQVISISWYNTPVHLKMLFKYQSNDDWTVISKYNSSVNLKILSVLLNYRSAIKQQTEKKCSL